jgi:hypothetical protein
MLGIFLRKIKDFPGENPDSLSPGPLGAVNSSIIDPILVSIMKDRSRVGQR